MKIRKIFPFETVILVILFIIMLFVGTTGLYSYQRLNSIVSNISYHSEPDNRLVIMKDILNDIYRSEISVKSFRLTKDENYLKEFYLSAKNINKRIAHLRKLAIDSDTVLIAIDSLDNLIRKEYTVLEELLQVKDEYRVKLALDKAMKTVDSNIVELEKVELISAVYDSVNTVFVNSDTVPEKKSSFFKRVFGSSKKKKQKEENSVASIVLTQAKDTITGKVDLNVINSQLAELSSEEAALELKMNIKELKLIREDESLMVNIRNVLIGMEIYQTRIAEQKTKRTEELAQEIKVLTKVFTFASLFLILFAAGMTLIYIRKSNQYKKVLRDERQKAEELASEKQRFLSNMSHEIRTPLNAIHGFTEQLLGTNLTELQKEHLVIVKKASSHLMQIINEVLDYSTIQAGKLVLMKTNFKPDEIIRDVAQLMLPTANAKNLKLIYASNNDQFVVAGDPMRLRQILLNLINNAIKYSECGEILVKSAFNVIDEKKMRLILTISDNGIGISAEFLNKVFDEFERAKVAGETNKTGSGLGLFITKKLVDLQNGTIQFQSQVGKGTTVNVSIPYQLGKADNIQVNQTKSTFNNIKNLNFLIVDDEEYNRKLIISILSKYGARYREAINGREAIEFFGQAKFDAVLMDILMPVMGGLEATLEIKKINKEIPILALTALVSEKDKAEFEKVWMNGTIPKPFTERELLSAISRLIEKKPIPEGKLISPKSDINFDELWKMCNYDKVFFNKMLDTFVASSTESIENMLEAARNYNLEQIAALAHKISAPAKHINGTKLVEYLDEIQKKCKESASLTEIDNIVKAAETELRKINQFILAGGKKF